MRNITVILVAGAMVFALGCDGGGGTDGGGITLMDGGPGSDAGGGGGSDAGGGGGSDAGGGGGACVLPTDPAMPISASCLPRCSRATRDAVIACNTSDPTGMMGCQRMALMADSTPADGTVPAAGGGTAPLNCEQCVNWQVATCLPVTCMAEIQACQMCSPGCDLRNPGAVGCETEEAAFLSCTEGMLFRRCVGPRVQQCFPM